MFLRFKDRQCGLDPITTGEAPYLTAQYREAMREIQLAHDVEHKKLAERERARRTSGR